MESNSGSFTVKMFDNSLGNRDSILTFADGEYIVCSSPKRKFWQVVLSWVSFGWYKAYWFYEVKRADNVQPTKC